VEIFFIIQYIADLMLLIKEKNYILIYLDL